MEKIGVIGDMHFKRKMSYSDYIEDEREKEKELTKDKIVSSFADCDKIVFLGDNLDKKNNPSQVLREFTSFLERFEDKNIYLLAGNHEKKADGSSAIDYLSEVKDKNWKVVAREVYEEDGLVFCPFFFNPELEADSNEKAKEEIMSRLPDGDILFHHHAVSKTKTPSGKETNTFPEPILPRKRLSKKYDLVFGGHIHKPNIQDDIVVTGSVTPNKMGEGEKYIFKVEDREEYEKIELPVRPIRKLVDPSKEEVREAGKERSIVKSVFTEKIPSKEFNEIVETGKEECDGFVVVERYPREREQKDYDIEKDIIDISVEDLLQEYAEQHDIEPKKLFDGFDLI